MRGWGSRSFGVPAAYVEALRRAGGLPVLVTSPEDDPDDLLSLVDGLLLMGGGDVEPSRYGGDPHDQVYGLEPDRDALEIDLVHAADRCGVPTLAICRGLQVLNVALGGTLHPHLPDVEGIGVHGAPLSGDPVPHDVELAAGSRVAEAMRADVVSGSSHHHQGLDSLGEGLIATGWTQDGLVEAAERETGWVVGVQWHPEETAAGDPSQQGLFDSLVRAAHRS